MKRASLLLSSFFFLLSFVAHAQNCQEIIAEVTFTDPPVVPADTGYIDICVGETVTFTGSGIYPENDLFYHQENDSSSFRWIVQGAGSVEGQTVQHTFNTAGGHIVQLQITDQEGCTNENLINLKVRVAGLPDVSFTSDNNLIACIGDTLEIQADYDLNSEFHFSDALESNDTVPLPDGTGVTYFSTLPVFNFEDGLVLSDVVQLASVCITIEHSWMHDLVITLTCPDGTNIILQNQDFVSNEVFLGIPYELDDFNTPNPPGIGQGFTYCWTPDATNGTWTEYTQNFDPQTLPEDAYNSFESFDNFLGCPLNGDWELSVQDQWGSDNGYVFGWSLTFEGVASETYPSFSTTIVDFDWTTGPFSEVVSETENNLEVVLGDVGDIALTLTDNWGCTETFTVDADVVSMNAAACQPCDSLLADAGPDLALNCVNALVQLDCGNSTSGNYITYSWLNETGQVVGNGCTVAVEQPGIYILEVTSLANGCIAYDSIAVVLDNEFPVADAGVDAFLSCSVSEVQLGGLGTTFGPNMIFSWGYNGIIISTEPFPVVNQAGTYQFTVTNTANGCVASDVVVVSDVLLLGLETTTTSCGIADGVATATISPSILNPTVNWSTGESGLQIDNLAQGWYSVTITDDTCTVIENFYVDSDNSCKVEISGYVYNDHANQDCLPDQVGVGEECVMLHLMPLDIYTYSDPSGHYEFLVDPGTYTIEILPEAYFELLCPDNPSFTIDLPDFGGVSEGHDFFLKYGPNSFDLSVSSYLSPAIRGFTQDMIVEVCNSGEAAVDAIVEIMLDSLLDDFDTDPMYDFHDAATNTLTWNLPNLQSGQCVTLTLDILISLSIDLATALSYGASVTPLDLDVNTTNNQKNWTMIVVGAYDPNDKQVHTGENQFDGNILRQDSVLQYQLRFQNVGTYPAQTVVIRDTLDSEHLDVTTIEPGLSSHDYILEFEGHNVLIFRFEDINLPDSTSNLEESQGFVSFSIELKDDLPFGTEIENSAAIFFDFNEPVITNTVVSTLFKPMVTFSQAFEICEGDEIEGVPYFESTTLMDTLDLVDYDSITITDLLVLPTFDITIDTTLDYGESYQGVVYESDTSFVQLLLTEFLCDSIVHVNITVEIVDSQEQFAKEIGLQVYPNPAKDLLQVQYGLPKAERVTVSIYDVLGHEVIRVLEKQVQTTIPHQHEVKLSSLPAGLYLLVVHSASGQASRKFVKTE